MAAREIYIGIQSCGKCGDKDKYPVEYSTLAGMKSRCYDVNHPRYKDYGGRGIQVCQRWRLDFLNFLEDMGRKPYTDYSIERINNDGHYEPNNCKWACAAEQANNQRSRGLNKKEVIEIYESKEDNKILAKKFGVMLKTIQNIRCGGNHIKWITEHRLSKIKQNP